MFRRSSALRFRRTPRFSSAELPHIITPEEAPPASEVKGFFFTRLNGPFRYFRLIDIKWIMNRLVSLKREGYIAAPVMYFTVWFIFYKLQDIYLWSDGAPPYIVDWNKEAAGNLPKEFRKLEA